ncbi:ATP-binding protein [Agathobaculum sp. NSJ-28]|uniref:ATP-binding protein n=1 Tax=Agathobaculum faecis TaxID=2763013 RepID=A0A923RWY4_9FIRM|nr:ATP-binding protein [Agathobaculum faecis]MBC5726434.1 ATP-binding protein [Agathobaculum faecis]
MAFIGKNVIENLTTAMYEDLRIIYREYIQNSADSIDRAVRDGIITRDEAKIDIDINARKRYISVMDNAAGIPYEQFVKIMSSIADSTKDRGEDKGFRGIGRLGGISSCETLIFSCSAPGEAVLSICKWDAKRVREILVDKTQNPSAAELVDMVTEFSQKEYDEDTHFFKVELIGVEKTSEELLQKDKVMNYLRSVAPIPYATGFIFKSKIADFASEHGFTIDEYQVFVCGERIFKPYTTKLYEPTSNGQKKAYDEIVDIAFKIFPENSDKPLAWMWYGISKFEKQIPSINPMRGIRLRKSNIQIGNENTFSAHDFYFETRGCLYFVGEVFAIDEDLIPNARRDYFNLNDTCREFERLLHPLFYDRFKTIYHYANDYKKALQKQQEFQTSQSDYQQKVTTGGFLNADDKQAHETKLESQEKAAEKATKQITMRDQKGKDDEVLSRVYQALRDKYPVKSTPAKLKPLKEATKGQEYMSQKLSKFSKKEQKTISRIYSILRAILPMDTANMVINKIQEELSK